MSRAGVSSESLEGKCLALFSDFFDDLDMLGCSGSANAGLGLDRGRQSTSAASSATSEGRATLALWLGDGSQGAEMEAEAHRRKRAGVDDEFALCMTEAEEGQEAMQLAVRLRHRVIMDVCAKLIPQLCALRTHAATSAAALGDPSAWHRSMDRLVASQTTREFWIYPLYRVFPQGPALVAKYLLKVFHHALSSDMSPAATQLADLEAFFNSAAYEIGLSPSGVLKRSFPLFEAFAEVALGLGRAQLSAAIAQKFGKQARCHSTAAAPSDSDTPHSIFDDASDCFASIRKRLVFVMRAVNGAESHWCYITALVQSCVVHAEEHLHSLSVGTVRQIDATVVTWAAWLEVSQALASWLAVPVSLHLKELAKTSLMSAQHTNKLFGDRPGYFLPDADRRTLVSIVTTSLLTKAPELKERLLFTDRITHLAPVPLHTRFCRSVNDDVVVSELMRKAHALLLPRNSTPVMPQWMQPEGEARGLSALERLGWSSRCFGDTPEFSSLHSDRGRITAERVILFHSFIVANRRHTDVYRRWSLHIPLLRKYLRSLFVRSPMVCHQLDDAAKRTFMTSLMSLIVEDPTASMSNDVFQLNAFDVLMEFTKAFPLTWTIESCQRVKSFIHDHIVGFVVDDDEDNGGDTLRLESITAVAALVFTVIADCVVDGLLTARNAFESRSSDERYDGAMCFSSEDAAIFEGFMKCVHDLMSVEFVVQLHSPPRQAPQFSHPPPLSSMARGAAGNERPPLALLPSADFASPSMDLISVPHQSSEGHSMWSDEYSEWNVASVAPSVAPPAASNRHSPLMPTPCPPPPPLMPEALPAEVRVGLDGRLLPLYVPWMKWVLQDLMVAPRFGDESAPVLSSDASMHMSVGQALADFVTGLICRKAWSVGTLRTLCTLLDSVCPNGDGVHAKNSSVKAASQHTVAHIPVNDVMAKGLTWRLFHGPTQMSRAPLDAAALRLISGEVHADDVIADALGSERAELVSRFLDSWRSFCTVFDS